VYYGSPWYWGWGWPYYAGYPYYSGYPYYGYYGYGGYPVYEPEPTVYVEREQPASPVAEARDPAPTLWYYCTDPAGYYPYVQNCSVPWVKVVPPPRSPATPSGSIAPGPASPAWQASPSGQAGK
jgi:hypothetical protein